jgi:UDP-glucose 4-epimerase
MHVLVSGGAGFIGSHLVEALLARGDEVTVIDDYSTGSPDNLRAAIAERRLHIIHGSVCDDLVVDEACTRVEAVIHLAAAVGVKRILDEQVRSIVTNLRGTEVMLRAATAHGCLPFFLASTSEVYGKLEAAPFREGDDSVLGASSLHRWSYACSKLMDEFLALAYHRERRLPVVIGRFFNITGPRQSPHYGMVLPRFCAAARHGGDLEVHGDGRQTRCFLHVKDCISALLLLLSCPAAVGEVVNIGGAEEIAIGDLAERVISLAGAGRVTQVSYGQAYPQGGFEDMRRRVPDVGKLVRLTAWRQRLDLTAMIRDCLGQRAGG